MNRGQNARAMLVVLAAAIFLVIAVTVAATQPSRTSVPILVALAFLALAPSIYYGTQSRRER